jgi:hypothetical protein
VSPRRPEPAASYQTPLQRREARQRSGWSQYLSVLEGQRVPDAQRQWYVRRAEAFVEAVRPARMGEVSAEPITAFFHRYGHEQRLSEWQFRQMVEAVQLLLVDLARNRAAVDIDCYYWMDAGKELAGGHPTLTAQRRRSI